MDKIIDATIARFPDLPASGLLPPPLKKGDKIAITCPAKKLPGPMTGAIRLLESWGLEVVVGETAGASFHQFAGDDDLRARDMQRFVDDDSVKAIVAARGGYGTIRMIDLVDFSKLAKRPKWLVGFSDITILHTHLFTRYSLHTIHGQMPINVLDASARSLETLRKALFGINISYELEPHSSNRTGEATGILVGGNLSLLIAAAGSVSDLDYNNKILFIEDVGEYLYAIDRMLRSLKRAGKLKHLSGLIAGSFTMLRDYEIPFGESVQQMILEIVKEYDYPVCFNFPAGHIDDNCSLLLGRQATLSVKKDGVSLRY